MTVRYAGHGYPSPVSLGEGGLGAGGTFGAEGGAGGGVAGGGGVGPPAAGEPGWGGAAGAAGSFSPQFEHTSAVSGFSVLQFGQIFTAFLGCGGRKHMFFFSFFKLRVTV